jgi:N-acylneuraminate cytidylyltransferase
MSIIALIPARGGSERIPRKNTRMLAGHPLIAYAIAGARNAGIFDGIYVSTEDEETQDIALKYGAGVIKRPKKYSTWKSPDWEWINHALKNKKLGKADMFVILRPTNPFRQAYTIRWAVNRFISRQKRADSLRTVRLVTETPFKMWLLDKHIDLDPVWMSPLCNDWESWIGPGFDLQTSVLPDVYIQTGCIQIFTRRTVDIYKNQTGVWILPAITDEQDAFDINTEADWQMAEQMYKRIKPEKI